MKINIYVCMYAFIHVYILVLYISLRLSILSLVSLFCSYVEAAVTNDRQAAVTGTYVSVTFQSRPFPKTDLRS